MLDLHPRSLDEIRPGSFIHGWTLARGRRGRLLREDLRSFSAHEADIVTMQRGRRSVEVTLSRRLGGQDRLRLLIETLLAFNDDPNARRRSYVH